ncbi:MAG: dihydrolipoyl dehydrogenase [Planctomycetota bacterium]
MSVKTYDVVVLGGGPGGYVAAIRAAQLGLKTVVVEKDNLGGICLNWGCIPTKALLKNAEHARIARTEGAEWGILYDNLRFDFERVIARSRDISARIVKGVEFLMKKNKIDVVHGAGSIKDKTTLAVEGTDPKDSGDIKFKNLIVATGARPRPLPGVPFDKEKVLSYFEAMVPKEVPEKIAIIGGGAIGCEFAYFYNAFGSEVNIFEMLPTLLPNEDPECTKELTRSFKKQGIKVHAGVKTEVSVTKNGVSIKAGNKTIEADKVLVSIGVQGNIENIGLEKVGIKTERGFIVTDDRYNTNVPGIRAIGDVTGRVMLAHVASHQGTVTAEDIAAAASGGGADHLVDYGTIPSCTYCQPQVASLGMSEEKAKEAGYDVMIGRYPFRPHGKAVATGENEGFVKLIFDKKYGELLGAHIVGHEATEMIAEAGAAISSGATADSLAATMHAHPTMSEAFHEATLDALGRAIHM